MGRQYKEPPLREAVCVFRFDPSAPWDDAVPGLVYERLEDDFPSRKQATDGRLFLSSPPPTVALKHPLDRVRFFDKEESSVVQVSPHFLAINQLAPYPSWERFQPKIVGAVEAYREVTNPGGVLHAELHYMNDIPITDDEFDINKYLNLYPSLEGDFPEGLVAFIAGAEFLVNDEQDLLRAEVRTQGQSLALSLRFRPAYPEAFDLENLKSWLESAHEHIEQAFETALTEDCKAIFGGTSE